MPSCLMQAFLAGIDAVMEATVPGRYQWIEAGQEFQVIVDAARTPEQMVRLLSDIRKCGPGKILLVFGCSGQPEDSFRQDRARYAAFRKDMGRVAHHKVQRLYDCGLQTSHCKELSGWLFGLACK